MKFNYRNLIVYIFALITAWSCQGGNKEKSPGENAGLHRFVAEEIIQASDYTYLRGKDNDKEVWIATEIATFAAGKTYYYKSGMEMKNFESKQLNRTFETLILVDKLSEDQGTFSKPAATNQDIENFDHKQVIQKEAGSTEPIKITPEKGCITVKELFTNKDKYKGKKIRVKGKVTKYNEGIMNKNWIHIKDGTDFNGKNDLTATSLAACKVGDIVIIEGSITVDKDFGYGYFFEIIMEDAGITQVKE